MTKSFFRKIFAVVCAAYFLLAGSGYNMIQYCCNGCAEEGIESVASKTCAGIHHNDQHDSTCCNPDDSSQRNDIACSDPGHQTDGCHLFRVSTDTPSIATTPLLQIADAGISLDLPNIILNLLEEESVFTLVDSFYPPLDIPLESGRDILTSHAVLLI